MAISFADFVEQRRNKILLIATVVAVYAALGFLLAPYLIKKNAIESVRETYDATLRIDKVAVNPFVLSVRADGIAMDDPDGNAFARLDQFYINFQLSSLFRWAATFAEIRFDAPEVMLARRAVGDSNFAFLLVPESAEVDESVVEDGAIPRLVVQNFSINAASLHWNDSVPREPVATKFGPVNVQVFDLSTLPQREGQQEVVITTESTGTFSWSGTLQLNPLQSAGRATIEGSHFPLLSAYIREMLGFEAVEGNASVGLDYRIETQADGSIDIDVDNFSLAFYEVLLRTYGQVTTAGADADRDVLALPSLRIDGGSLRYPEQVAAIGSISIDEAILDVYRDPAGELNIVVASDVATDVPTAEEAEEADTAEGESWSISLDRININEIDINLVDDSVTPQAVLGVRDLDIEIANISNQPGDKFPTELALTTMGGASVSLSGEIGALPQPAADLELAMSGIALELLHPYIKSLADVHLDSGALGMNARLHVGADEVLAVSGDMAVSDFLITETDQGTRLGSWDNISVNQFALSLSQETLGISEIQVDRAYGDILITEDGSINLGRAALGEQVVAEDEAAEEQESQAATADARPVTEDGTETKPLPLAVTIGRVVVNDAAADFEDRSLPLPFDVRIAGLNGTLTTIASASSEPSTAALEGSVDEFGLVRVSGTLTPLEPPLNTDIKVDFENIAMPKFSAYSVPFAGREIASGKLDLFLVYRLEDGDLVGENQIVMRDFELGDKVEHPGASSLPLGLAVALLKGPDGTIDIDLPVRGNVNEPSFRYGRVVGEALVNLIVKIVASPFTLLGKLVGVEADELEFIAFQDGRADLTPPEQEKVAKLAEALALRPELAIEIYGVIDREADGLALRTARLDAQVDQQIEADSSGEEDAALYADQRTEVLEAMLVQKDVLKQLRSEHTLDGEFDALAYTAALRRLLIDRQTLEESEFVALAQARAANVKAGIITANPALESQILAGELQAIEKGDDATINMKVVLAVDEGDG